MSREGRPIPLDQIGRSEISLEEPILKRRDRTPVITIRSEINEATQPPEVSMQVLEALQPLIASLPAGYRIELGGSIAEAGKANAALAKIFPAMIAITLIVIMIQVRSFSTMAMVVLTAPLGLIGVVPVLLAFNQPFGFNARGRCRAPRRRFRPCPQLQCGSVSGTGPRRNQGSPGSPGCVRPGAAPGA